MKSLTLIYKDDDYEIGTCEIGGDLTEALIKDAIKILIAQGSSNAN